MLEKKLLIPTMGNSCAVNSYFLSAFGRLVEYELHLKTSFNKTSFNFRGN